MVFEVHDAYGSLIDEVAPGEVKIGEAERASGIGQGK